LQFYIGGRVSVVIPGSVSTIKKINPDPETSLHWNVVVQGSGVSGKYCGGA